jgi:hypothetical protein
MAQGYAAMRMRGISGIWEGITFPIKNEYVSLTDFATSGKYIGAVAGVVAMGQIYVCGQTFVVSLIPATPTQADVPTYIWRPAGVQ